MPADVEVAAIYFPSWHDEPRRAPWLGEGFTEWDLIKAGRPRFDGHYQPQIPTLGYLDESVPENMQRSCDLAAGAGIDAFLWDWYWYDGADFLNRPLNETFLELPDPGIKFALMWANHDWRGVFPGNVGEDPELWFKGAVDEAEFLRMTDAVIQRYFAHPAYWRVDGKAWFTVFLLDELVTGLGGPDRTRALLDDFRARARAAGCGELHLNALGAYESYEPAAIAALGFDSVGTYGWPSGQWADLPDGRLTYEYEEWRAAAQDEWRTLRDTHSVDFVPTVAMGWDSTTRVNQEDTLVISEWPYFPVVVGNTPESFGASVTDALTFAADGDGAHVVIVNAWNEWTEGSYLEPDSRTGDAHLQALARAVSARTRTATAP